MDQNERKSLATATAEGASVICMSLLILGLATVGGGLVVMPLAMLTHNPDAIDAFQANVRGFQPESATRNAFHAHLKTGDDSNNQP